MRIRQESSVRNFRLLLSLLLAIVWLLQLLMSLDTGIKCMRLVLMLVRIMMMLVLWNILNFLLRRSCSLRNHSRKVEVICE